MKRSLSIATLLLAAPLLGALLVVTGCGDASEHELEPVGVAFDESGLTCIPPEACPELTCGSRSVVPGVCCPVCASQVGESCFLVDPWNPSGTCEPKLLCTVTGRSLGGFVRLGVCAAP